jgi:DNA-binding MarR family transcriptional regulator
MTSLDKELGWRRGFTYPQHEGLLGIYFTGDLIRKRAREFFSGLGLTDVQFNVMKLIELQSGDGEGLTQTELSRMLLVNRSNITSLIDRMERAGLVSRGDVPDDRRSKLVTLTEKGKRSLIEIEGRYMGEVNRIMNALTKDELQLLVEVLGKIRKNL